MLFHRRDRFLPRSLTRPENSLVFGVPLDLVDELSAQSIRELAHMRRIRDGHDFKKQRPHKGCPDQQTWTTQSKRESDRDQNVSEDCCTAYGNVEQNRAQAQGNTAALQLGSALSH